MYKINSKVDKPDIVYLENRMNELMDIGIEVGEVEEIYKTFKVMRDSLSDDITRKYGIKNPNSGPQIINYLQSMENPDVYDVCFINGKWTTKKESLTELASMGYEIAIDIMYYRKARKFADSIKSMMDARSDKDNRVHPKVSLGRTNRINYSEPPLMNIPKDLLWNIVVPRKSGNKLYSVDIKNQEPSILINMLGIDSLKPALEDLRGLYEYIFERVFSPITKVTIYVTKDAENRIVSGEEMGESKVIPPSHYNPIRPLVSTTYYKGEKVKLIEVCNVITNLSAKEKDILMPETVVIETMEGNVYNVPVEWDKIPKSKLKSMGYFDIKGDIKGLDVRCEKTERTEFKQSWNAMTYNASMLGVKRICKNIDGELVFKYFNGIPEFKGYKKRCNELVKSGRTSINTLFGTKLQAFDVQYERLLNVIMDLPIQGTGADILALLVKHLDNEVVNRGLSGKLELYYTRHDEIILEIDKDWLNEVGEDKVKEEIKDILEHQIDDWIPFKIEVEEVRAKEIQLDEGEDDIFE